MIVPPVFVDSVVIVGSSHPVNNADANKIYTMKFFISIQ
jgi:hypothetical protein